MKKYKTNENQFKKRRYKKRKTRKYKKSKRGGTLTRQGARVGVMDSDIKSMISWFFPSEKEKEQQKQERDHKQREKTVRQLKAANF